VLFDVVVRFSHYSSCLHLLQFHFGVGARCVAFKGSFPLTLTLITYIIYICHAPTTRRALKCPCRGPPRPLNGASSTRSFSYYCYTLTFRIAVTFLPTFRGPSHALNSNHCVTIRVALSVNFFYITKTSYTNVTCNCHISNYSNGRLRTPNGVLFASPMRGPHSDFWYLL
jgi:hypothetical protein